MYLKLRAAFDLLENGYVEHIDMESLVEKKSGFKIIHKERKNLGMTYIYILKVEKEEEKEEGSDLK